MSCHGPAVPASLHAWVRAPAWAAPPPTTSATRPGSVRPRPTREGPLLLPEADEVGGGGEGGDEGKGVVEDRLGVVGGNTRYRVPGDHDLVAVVDGVEGQVLDGDVHRHADGDDRRYTHVAKHRAELR